VFVQKGSITDEQKAVCGDNMECLYDFYITGNQSFAEKTKSNINKVETLEVLAKKVQVFCPDLPKTL